MPLALALLLSLPTVARMAMTDVLSADDIKKAVGAFAGEAPTAEPPSPLPRAAGRAGGREASPEKGEKRGRGECREGSSANFLRTWLNRDETPR